MRVDTLDRIDAGPGLAAEEMPSLADFAEEPGGAWPKGWYRAEFIEGYATTKGTQFTTKDEPSKNGTSRNLTLCLRIAGDFYMNDGERKAGPGGVRNTFEQINYRLDDFTPAKLAMVKELRESNKGVRGAWPGQADQQRTSLALAKLGQIEKAMGATFKRTPLGLSASHLSGRAVDVRLGVDDKGYNEVTAFAPAGSRVK
jgi:hypothetical protein